jgi:ADP-ribose pyrophosphatase YjhB (NUDIX family)
LSYVTPKIAVAIAVFDERDAILLVERADNGSWALPGGWADVGYSAVENALRELYQETGLSADCDGLIGVYDGRRHPVGVLEESLYTLVFHGRLVGGEISPHRHEIAQARFAEVNETMLRQLAGGALRHVEDAIAYHKSPTIAYFDVASIYR